MVIVSQSAAVSPAEGCSLAKCALLLQSQANA